MLISELELRAGNLNALREFYVDRLGLPMAESGGRALSISVGASRLAFSPVTASAPARYHFAFNIPENQLGAGKDWLRQRVPLIANSAGDDEFFFDSWNAHACFCYDPAGNIVELIARHELPNAASAPFNAGSLLAISEIGLGAADVPALVVQAQATLGLQPYHSGLNNTFVPLGDAHGLIIVVDQQRQWFPDTGVPAGSPPLRAKLMLEGGKLFVMTGPPYQFAMPA